MLHAPPAHTVEQYFATEYRTEYRNEYRDGQILVLPSGTADHNRITMNVAVALRNHLRPTPCEVFMLAVRIFIEKCAVYTYPDIMVICGSLQHAPGRNDTVTNPALIVEVLSPSTEAYDRGKKFEFYRTIDSLKEYVLIDQSRMVVDRHRPLGLGRWEMTAFENPDDVLALTSVGVDLTLAAIYEGVELES